MFKHIAFGIAYCIVASYVALCAIQSGWVLPAELAPPTDWPFSEKARANYKPVEHWKSSLEYFR